MISTKRFPGSLQSRLVLILIGLSTYIWIVAAALTVFDTRHEIDELLDSHLSLVASTLLSDASAQEPDHEVDAPTLHRLAPRVAFQVFVDQKLTVHSLNAPHAPLAKVNTGFSTVKLGDGSEWRVFGTSRNDGRTQVYVGEQTSAREDILLSILRSILWPIALAIPLLVAGAWWSVRMTLTPFARLRAALALRQAHPRGNIDFLDAPDEIKPIVAELNGLLAQLNDQIEKERQFTSDVAHELRTPIAAIKINLDVLGAQIAHSESHISVVHALQHALKRTTRLIDQLLELSRVNTLQESQIRWTTDLVATVGDVAAELAPMALDRKQAVFFDRPDGNADTYINGRPELIASLIRNLVDNSSKYGGPNAVIRLSVESRGDKVLFSIEDSGPGLSQVEQAQLGTRYFRGDRNLAVGSGLGWSIVRKIAEQTQAQIGLSTSTKLGGLRVEVVWPSIDVLRV